MGRPYEIILIWTNDLLPIFTVRPMSSGQDCMIRAMPEDWGQIGVLAERLDQVWVSMTWHQVYQVKIQSGLTWHRLALNSIYHPLPAPTWAGILCEIVSIPPRLGALFVLSSFRIDQGRFSIEKNTQLLCRTNPWVEITKYDSDFGHLLRDTCFDRSFKNILTSKM